MAATVTFHYLGPPEQKHVAKVGPMARLRDALAEGAAKWRPPLDPATAVVTLAKKPVDLDTPFRLLNIPSGSRLDVARGTAGPQGAAAGRGGGGASGAAGRAARFHAGGHATPTLLPPNILSLLTDPAGAVAAAPAAAAGPSAAAAAPRPEAAPAAAAAAAPPAAAAAAAAPAAAPPPAAAAPSAPPAASGAAAAGGTAAGAPAAAGPAPDPELAALGIAVPIAVFSQAAVEAAAAAAGAAGAGDDPPDEFFEFTADDFLVVSRAAKQRAEADSVLLTRSAREARARAAAEALPPVPVRLHFPDGAIVQVGGSWVRRLGRELHGMQGWRERGKRGAGRRQPLGSPCTSSRHGPTPDPALNPLSTPTPPPQAEFAATQPVGDVAALARALVSPALAPGLYLYTTPPKAVLKDPAATLFDLRLLPAAHVHVGSGAAGSSGGGGWLRPEVAARMSDAVPGALEARGGGGGGEGGGGGGASAAERERERERALAAARRAAAGAGGGAGGGDGERKVPKWLKR
jgi:hypothetical protein